MELTKVAYDALKKLAKGGYLVDEHRGYAGVTMRLNGRTTIYSQGTIKLLRTNGCIDAAYRITDKGRKALSER